MFEFVRKHTKIMMFLLFLLIIPSFVLFGIDGYTKFREKGEAVARVGDHDITQEEWDNAHKNQIERIRAQMPTIDVKMLDSPEAKYATLERLVRERVLSEAVDKTRLQTSDARLARELQQDQTIASLRKADGTMDMERYRQLAAGQGLTPEGFEARVRRDLSVRQVEQIIQSTGFAGASQAAVSLNAFFGKREIQYVVFAPSAYQSKVTPTDAELQGFYKDNQALFKAQETADIEYLVLDLEGIKKTIVLNEGDLKTYYEQNLARLAGAEERRASHILINAPKGGSADDKAKARAKAVALRETLGKTPDAFADLAKKNSQDPGSAERGGDLDFFSRGSMVKPFEDAAFALKKGDISDVVESDFGFHIIRVTDIKEAKTKSFEESRASLEADLKTQQAKTKYAELADQFTNGVYEQSDSLKPTADKLKLPLQTAKGLTRKGPAGLPPGAPALGPLANAKLLAALFGSDALEKKRNTEAIETATNQMVSARVVKHQPATTLPFAEVSTSVRERLVSQRALELAKKDSTEKFAAWKANLAAANFPVAVTVSRDQTATVPVQVVEAVLKADTSLLPTLITVDLGGQGAALAKINAVVARAKPDDAAALQERQQYSAGWSAAESQAYFNGLKEKFKASILVKKPSRSSLEEIATAGS